MTPELVCCMAASWDVRCVLGMTPGIDSIVNEATALRELRPCEAAGVGQKGHHPSADGRRREGDQDNAQSVYAAFAMSIGAHHRARVVAAFFVFAAAHHARPVATSSTAAHHARYGSDPARGGAAGAPEGGADNT